jgi:alkanesulfonate monooxygenase SsuD/methylene tetrahydromethanopterin reductase-like flavin-dependent oxidoreductase (luciferase family)
MSAPETTTNSRRPLKVGYFIPAQVGGMADGALRWDDIRAMAQRAEELGFDSFWLPDHLLTRFEGDPEAHGPWECWSLLCALAASTTRLELGTGVVCTSFRNPALLAKMADTLDEISDGRLILGLGAGWSEPEYHAFGYPFDHRVSRFAEALEIITTLLREGKIDFEGKYYTARECELVPRGPRPHGLPIMVGTLKTGSRMLKLTAERADIWNGWLRNGRNYPDVIPALRDAVDAACVAAGRDPATLVRTAGIEVDQRPASERPPRTEGGPETVTGSPEEIADVIRGFAREGITHLQIVTAVNGLEGVEKLAPVLEALDRG